MSYRCSSWSCCLVLFWFVATVSAVAQTIRVYPEGPDQQRVEVTTTRVIETGDWVTENSGYVEMATGLNHWDDSTRSWQPSAESIEIVGRGGAALRGPHKTYLAPTLDDRDGSVDLLTMTGERFRSAILSLSYFDPVSGQRATIGLVKDVGGLLLPPNQVIYPDAFEPTHPDHTVHCDIVYTYRRSGIEQDVVIRELLPPPEAFGLQSDLTRLEVVTEFFEAPEPQRNPRLLAAVEDEQLRAKIAQPDWYDECLDFGSAVIGAGRAFRLADEPALPATEPGALAVGKTWIEQEDGRRLLIEAVELAEILPMLMELPGAQEAAVSLGFPQRLWSAKTPAPRAERLAAVLSQNSEPRSPLAQKFPSRRMASVSKVERKLLLASGGVTDRPGVVLDYVTMAVNSTNFTFRGDETYLISDTLNLSGTTTLEGGAVLKYSKYLWAPPVPQITILGPFVCATSPYRPAIFTAADDQTVGQYINGSAATPSMTNYYVTHGLWFQNDPSVVNLDNVRFRYGWHTVILYGRSGIIRNSQFQHCAYPVYASGAVYLNVYNMLAANSVAGYAPFKSYYGGKIIGEHVTIAGASNLIDQDTGTKLTLRNSILAGITTIQTYTGRSNAAYGNFEASTTNGLFQPVGAAGYYLGNSSPHRNAGVSTIDGSLAADLTTLTTYPPVVLTSDFLTDTTLAPQAPRDADTPDRGYHYAPLDYCLTSLNLTNCTLTLTNGVAVGIYGPKGLTLRRGAKLVSEGSPGALNRIVRFNVAQEQTLNWGNAPTNSFVMLESNSTGSPAPSARLLFTEVSHLAITTNTTTARRFLQAGSSAAIDPLALSHCQLRGVNLDVTYAAGGNQTVALTNNLFDGSALSFFELAAYNTYNLTAYNNLFFRGRVTFDNQDSAFSWTIKDNLFDGDVATATGYVTASNNGFRSGLASFGSSAKTGLVPDYIRGPLGRFYYPTAGASTSLTNLMDTGSRTAAAGGLYHLTTRADQTKEGTSNVDIGFHYAAGTWLNNRVSFVGTDTTTQGSWKGKYGSDGYYIVSDTYLLPPYAGFSTVNTSSQYTWASSTSDVRALERAGTGRVAACWYAGTSLDIAFFGMYDNRPHRLAVYNLDWDSLGRNQTVEIREYVAGSGSTTGQLLDARTVSSFSGGKYLIWDIQGSFVIRLINNGPAVNGVISGVFFSPSSGVQGPTDYDGDGTPDYVEDRNGNGSVDSGETDWQVSPGGAAGSSWLQVFTPLR